MKNKEKFLGLVTEKDNSVLKDIKARKANREMLKESQNIAFKVLIRLNELGWSQKDLAGAMQVSPQQINKIVKGTENLTLETQVKLQSVLNIGILASYNEKQAETTQNTIVIEKKNVAYSIRKRLIGNYSRLAKKTKVIKLGFDKATSEYKPKQAV